MSETTISDLRRLADEALIPNKRSARRESDFLVTLADRVAAMVRSGEVECMQMRRMLASISLALSQSAHRVLDLEEAAMPGRKPAPRRWGWRR
jgi:hypothetical protein